MRVLLGREGMGLGLEEGGQGWLCLNSAQVALFLANTVFPYVNHGLNVNKRVYVCKCKDNHSISVKIQHVKIIVRLPGNIYHSMH